MKNFSHQKFPETFTCVAAYLCAGCSFMCWVKLRLCKFLCWCARGVACWRVCREKRRPKKWKERRTRKGIPSVQRHKCTFSVVLVQLFVGWDRLERRSFFLLFRCSTRVGLLSIHWFRVENSFRSVWIFHVSNIKTFYGNVSRRWNRIGCYDDDLITRKRILWRRELSMPPVRFDISLNSSGKTANISFKVTSRFSSPFVEWENRWREIFMYKASDISSVSLFIIILFFHVVYSLIAFQTFI